MLRQTVLVEGGQLAEGETLQNVGSDFLEFSGVLPQAFLVLGSASRTAEVAIVEFAFAVKAGRLEPADLGVDFIRAGDVENENGIDDTVMHELVEVEIDAGSRVGEGVEGGCCGGGPVVLLLHLAE